MKIICPYCKAPAVFTDSAKVYGKSYGMIYLCSNYPRCDSWVGVHKGTDRPLGRMANKELRYWKKQVHAEFDRYWKTKILSRGEAYRRLSLLLGIPQEETHIGTFDVQQCRKILILLEKTNLKEMKNV